MKLVLLFRRVFLSLKPVNALPIGVDFAAECLNMVQMEVKDGITSLRAATSVPYSEDREFLFSNRQALKNFVRTALSTGPFLGREVYSVLPPSDVRILPISVTVAAGQFEEQVIAKAAREQLAITTTDTVVDYYKIRNVDGEGQERHVLIAVAQLDKVTSYLNALESAGLRPVGLDIGPAALARVLSVIHKEDREQSVLLINFGVYKSYLTVVWGRRLLLDREIEFGEQQLIEKLVRSLGINSEIALSLLREHGIGASNQNTTNDVTTQLSVARTIREILHSEFSMLAEEVTKTQVYVASKTRGSMVSRIYLNGAAARYPNIQQKISDLTALPVDILNPFDAFKEMPPSVGLEIAHSVGLAAGLALRKNDLDQGHGRIDMIPQIYYKRTLAKKSLKTFSFAILALSFVSIVSFIALQRQVMGENAKLTAAHNANLNIESVRKQIGEGQSQLVALERSASILAKLRDAGKVEAAANALDRALIDGVWLKEFRYTRSQELITLDNPIAVLINQLIVIPAKTIKGSPTPEQTWLISRNIEIDGEAINHTEMAKFMRTLSSEPAIANVRFVSSRAGDLEDGQTVVFSLTAILLGKIGDPK